MNSMLRIITVSHEAPEAALQFDGSFRVSQRLVPSLQDGRLGYRIQALEQAYEKSYADEPDDGPSDLIRLAYSGEQAIGRIDLSRGWNGLAVIDNLVVDRAWRRSGAATALIGDAVAWARAEGLAGLMLETQDSNVAACRLYERCGFVLMGFDGGLYRALPGAADELALFWYRLF
ncbi:GNAT family N-acetyltransferase [Paucibacter sp. O1-1]|nr:GNAT family N-acetyltransferase [Paucibacter sp. O1-1]MDA3829091.1 GNAT family N-acetyltransferase [Paucibacter sp. O1-1]